MERAGKERGHVARADLPFVSLPTGENRRVIDAARGIWNPRNRERVQRGQLPHRAVLGPRSKGRLFHYSYREGSINGDNAKLRRAFELGLPIILLRKVRDGVYVPYAPVYVVDDLVAQREFLLALDESVRFLGGGMRMLPERRYAERVVKQRLHQAEFRGRVIAAYQTRCTICRLRHGELLDAAHIIADSEMRVVRPRCRTASPCARSPARRLSTSTCSGSLRLRRAYRSTTSRGGRRAYASSRSSRDAWGNACRSSTPTGSA